mmetsp:Transcript_24785/g.59860  ORF Transcript_24785/g.59860 Transcript_24785/m.59860 type:complete len:330 (-) Transcript_24785:1018-2007(-)
MALIASAPPPSSARCAASAPRSRPPSSPPHSPPGWPLACARRTRRGERPQRAGRPTRPVQERTRRRHPHQEKSSHPSPGKQRREGKEWGASRGGKEARPPGSGRGEACRPAWMLSNSTPRSQPAALRLEQWTACRRQHPHARRRWRRPPGRRTRPPTCRRAKRPAGSGPCILYLASRAAGRARRAADWAATPRPTAPHQRRGSTPPRRPPPGGVRRRPLTSPRRTCRAPSARRGARGARRPPYGCTAWRRRAASRSGGRETPRAQPSPPRGRSDPSAPDWQRAPRQCTRRRRPQRGAAARPAWAICSAASAGARAHALACRRAAPARRR